MCWLNGDPDRLVRKWQATDGIASVNSTNADPDSERHIFRTVRLGKNKKPAQVMCWLNGDSDRLVRKWQSTDGIASVSSANADPDSERHIFRTVQLGKNKKPTQVRCWLNGDPSRTRTCNGNLGAMENYNFNLFHIKNRNSYQNFSQNCAVY